MKSLAQTLSLTALVLCAILISTGCMAEDDRITPDDYAGLWSGNSVYTMTMNDPEYSDLNNTDIGADTYQIGKGSSADLVLFDDDCPITGNVNSSGKLKLQDTVCVIEYSDGKTLTMFIHGKGEISDGELELVQTGTFTIRFDTGTETKGNIRNEFTGERY